MENIKIKNENSYKNAVSIFDNLFNNESLSKPKASVAYTSPAVNIRETENDFFIDFAIPSIDKEKVMIELDNEILTVSSEVEEEKERNFTRREFHYASFKRSFSLPDTVNTTKIKASYSNGVLNISIPKKEEAKPKPKRNIQIGK